MLDNQGYLKGERITIWAATVDAPNAFGTLVRSYVMCDETLEHGLIATLLDDLSLYGVPSR